MQARSTPLGSCWPLSAFSGLLSADNVEAEVCLAGSVCGPVDLVEDLVEYPHQDVQGALIAPDRVAVMMMTIEDWESDADQRRFRVAFQVLAVSVANQEIDGLGEQQRAHVPEILARVGVTIRAERRTGQQFIDLFKPRTAAVGAENVDRLGSQFKQEGGET